MNTYLTNSTLNAAANTVTLLAFYLFFRLNVYSISPFTGCIGFKTLVFDLRVILPFQISSVAFKDNQNFTIKDSTISDAVYSTNASH